MVTTTAPQLRGYQRGLIEDVRREMRKHRRVVLQSPTGSGKTVLTAHMIREAAAKGLRATFLVHRRELLEQTSAALWRSGVQHGMIAAGKAVTADPVQVATVQTLARRVKALPTPHLLVIDEAHHTAAASYRSIVEAYDRAWIIGLTATPCRTDGRGLDDLFDAIVPGPSVSTLIEDGYLARYRVIAPTLGPDTSGVHTRGGDYARDELDEVVSQSVVIAGNVEHYLKFVAPRSCLVYCVSRKHAKLVEEAYRAAGVDARYCAGDTEDGERRDIVARFRDGRLPVIVSVDLFSEGLDVPGLQAVQLLRPTQSLSLHLQQVGRALRPEPGKDVALILDQAGNTGTRQGGRYVPKHGLPDDDRRWTLEGRKKGRRKAEEAGPALRHCGDCFAVYSASKRACPCCGKEYIAQGRRVAEIEGDLAELNRDEIRNGNAGIVRPLADAQAKYLRSQRIRQASTLEDLVRLAVEFGYKATWAAFKYVARHGGDRVATIRAASRIAKRIQQDSSNTAA